MKSKFLSRMGIRERLQFFLRLKYLFSEKSFEMKPLKNQNNLPKFLRCHVSGWIVLKNMKNLKLDRNAFFRSDNGHGGIPCDGQTLYNRRCEPSRVTKDRLKKLFLFFSIGISLLLTSCIPSPQQGDGESPPLPPPIKRMEPKRPDPVKQKECQQRGQTKCEGEEECEDICNDIFRGRANRQDCYEYSLEMVSEFENLLGATEDGRIDEIEAIGSLVLECMLDIDEREFAKAIRGMSRREGKEFALLIAENEDFAEVLRDEDDEFNILKQLLNELFGSSELEESLSREVEDDKTLLWLFAEYEYAWEWLDSYVDEECDGRNSRDCPGGENIRAYCNALLKSGFSPSEWMDFLSDAVFFAEDYEGEVENADYEYEITSSPGSGYTRDFRDYCELKANKGICGRTEEVIAATIAHALRRIPSQIDCAEVTFAELQTIETLDLSGRRITTLQDGDFSRLTVKTLLLNNNSLSSLPADVFDRLTFTGSEDTDRTLDLSHNNLNSLPADVFEGLTELEKLHITHNSLNSLPANVFDGLTNLQQLFLNNNNLNSLPDNVFDGLANLGLLNLSNNQLTRLPDNVFDGPAALISLNLSDNQLTHLPDAVFDNLSDLSTIDLSNNQLTSLQPGLFANTSITVVRLKGNNFTDAEKIRLNNELGTKIQGGF